MAKPIPSKFLQKSRVKKKHQPKSFQKANINSWMIVGVDQSVSSIALAAIAYDGVLKKHKGPEFALLRWSKEDHYFDRLKEASKVYELIQELQRDLGIIIEPEQVWIAQEEPFPPGGSSFTSKNVSQTLKQQAEISGAFLSGLLRYGFNNLWQIGNYQWRQIVAADLGITIHHTKWKNPTLCPLPEDWEFRAGAVGKFRAKQWAMQMDGWKEWGGNEIPDFLDIIDSKNEGKIPRPKESKAKGIQCDDRYEALAIMEVLRRDLVEQKVVT